MTEFAYDLRDRLTNIVYRSPSGAELARFDYSLDAIGRIVDRVVDVRAGGASRPRRAVFAYDDLDRLVSERIESAPFGTNPPPRQMTYAYDLAGNRLRKTDTDSGAVDYTLGLGDRLATFTGGAYEYNPAGCVTNISGGASSPSEPLSRALAWNAQYQLSSVSTNGAFAESWTWDALGRRSTTTTAEGTVRHVYDGDQCIADLDESGSVIRSYTWGPGIDYLLSVAVADGNGQPHVYYALTDHQNTVHGFVDSTGALVAHYVYDAWGNILQSSVSVPALANNRYLFQGREYSWSTGLYNFRARWYDPATGRWLSKDPIGISGGMNLYLFCEGDSINSIDPSGCGKFKLVFRVGQSGLKAVKSIKRDLAKLLFKKKGVDVSGSKNQLKKWAKEKGMEKPSLENHKGGTDHYHPAGRITSTGKHGGHGFINRNFTAVGIFGDNLFSEVIDFINPISDVCDLLDLIDSGPADDSTLDEMPCQ